MPQDPWAVVKHEDAPASDPWAVVSATTPTGIPQQMLADNLRRNVNPTQFENNRNPDNQPGMLSSAASEIGNFVSNIPSAIGGMAHPFSTAMSQAADLAVNNQLRKDKGQSGAYRTAVALGTPLGVNATKMEQQADVGNMSGIVGTAIGDAAPYVAAYAGPKVAGAIKDTLPSTVRAGETMNAVKSAAGDIPINVGDAGNVALRTQELSQTGGSMPKVIRDFLRRASDPTKGPLTYSEAQDFYSNASRISANEYGNLTPTMQRQVGMFTQELSKAMKGAADQVGMGDQLVQGKAEYSKAMNNQKAMQGIKDALIKKALPIGVGGLVADHVINKVLSRK